MDVNADSYNFVVIEEFYMSPCLLLSDQQQITIKLQTHI